MPVLSSTLDLMRCPHCGVNTPNLFQADAPFITTKDHLGGRVGVWGVYMCKRCGNLVLACAPDQMRTVMRYYPGTQEVDEAIPSPAKEYLQQAQDTVFAPAGSIMLSASAVDAMLKAKSYADGSLYSRIDKAANDHLIQKDMAAWAHEVRLDANGQRHADKGTSLPTREDAERCVDFAAALAEFLFVLPSRVRRGLDDAKGKA